MHDKDSKKDIHQTDYNLLIQQADALTRDCPHIIANLANTAALLYTSLDDINWAGFYFVEDFFASCNHCTESKNTAAKKLVLGPFQGNPACIEIPLGKGVCGTAAAKDETQLVPDVHQFPGHIACDSASRSEIVVPIHKDGSVVGVLDIDSPSLSRFTEADKAGLESLAATLEHTLFS